ncbi:unnamed protein product [Toxocara canis]|uniref:50S ribosomal protein L14 n=1 Tax=Toxocara canis TaxID=6265 RepID=A0A183U3Z1_TOXCA|nr:unnamed protein product [Toxocara canis]
MRNRTHRLVVGLDHLEQVGAVRLLVASVDRRLVAGDQILAKIITLQEPTPVTTRRRVRVISKRDSQAGS